MMRRSCHLSMALAALTLGSACWSSDVVVFEMALGGSVEEVAADEPVWVEAYYQSIGTGVLETDIFLIEAFELPGGGPFSHTLNYPLEGGRGLFLFAWADLDGDQALCAPGVLDEPVGGLLIEEPTEQALLDLVLRLDDLCTGPEQFAASLQP